MPLATAERIHRGSSAVGAAYFAERFGRGLVVVPPPDVASGRSVAVFVSWGQWTVACPDCFSAQPAFLDDHRFLCAECGNFGDGWHSVSWPTNVEAIEAVLMARPVAATRNWRPGETLDVLRAENIAHGVDPGPPDPADMQRALGYRRSAD